MRPCEPQPRRVTMPHAHADEPRRKTPRTRDARARAAHRRIMHMGKDQLSISQDRPPTLTVIPSGAATHGAARGKTDHRRCPPPRAARQRTERHTKRPTTDAARRLELSGNARSGALPPLICRSSELLLAPRGRQEPRRPGSPHPLSLNSAPAPLSRARSGMASSADRDGKPIADVRFG